jgi:hypothetical protein
MVLALGFSGLTSCGVSPTGFERVVDADPLVLPIAHPGDTATATVIRGEPPFYWEAQCACITLDVAADSLSALVTAVEAGDGWVEVSNPFGVALLRVVVTNP